MCRGTESETNCRGGRTELDEPRPSPPNRCRSALSSARSGFHGIRLAAAVGAALLLWVTPSGCGTGETTGDEEADVPDTRSCSSCTDTQRANDEPDAAPRDLGGDGDTSTSSPDASETEAGDTDPDGDYDGTCNHSAPCDLDCASTGEPFTCHGVSFERVVNIVDAHGADPTGKEPIDDALQAATSADTLVMFPEGTYKVTEQHVLADETFGFAGAGDVTLVPPTGYNDQLFNSSPNSLAERVVFENFDIDIREQDTTAGLKFYTRSGFHVEDVRYLGRGMHSDAGVVTAFSLGVIEDDGIGVLKDCVARKGSTWARYKAGDGRVGIGIFEPHAGTVRVVNCEMMEFGNNGMYASRHGGDVQVIGGVYRNNNAAAIRMHGDGSYLDGARIEVDPAKYTGPRESNFEDSAFALRGFIAEQKLDRSSSVKEPGVEIRNADIVYRENPSGAAFPVQSKYTGKTLLVKNTRIVDDEDGKPAILRDVQERRARRPSSSPRWLKLQNVHITGDASGGAAVEIIDGDGSVVENSCISQSGEDRDGIRFVRSEGRVESTSISASGNQLVRENASVETSGLTNDGNCQSP